METHVVTSTCACHNRPAVQKPEVIQHAASTAKSIPSVLLSMLIAFFPKCPLCWAVYMSMFSSLGISRLPYMKWLLPVLILLLALHLYLLIRRVKAVGYLPLLLSICGAFTVLLSRSVLSLQTWLPFAGIAFIVTGSLLNNFSVGRIRLKTSKNNLNL